MSAMINVRYFALLRDVAGKSSEAVPVEQGDTAASVFNRLARQYGFPLDLSAVRLAVNDEFAQGDQRLADGDRLVFIPPVAGG